MLIFPLKKEWYEKIKSGEKTVEYREVKDYWTKRLISIFGVHGELYCPIEIDVGCFLCKLRLGYTKEYLTAWLTKIEIVDGINTDLKIDKKVYAIHFMLEK